jgi:small GTP-binding protein
MPNFDDFLKRFPPDVQNTVRTIWDALGIGEKNRFLDLISNFPNETSLVKGLVKLTTAQIRQAFGTKRNVAIIGPANVGKSTLYNQMVHNKEDLAAVSPLPGTTHQTQHADAGLFTVVDTPGADAVGSLGEHERQLALSAASQADFLVLMYDAIQGIKKTEQEIFHQLSALKRPFIVVLNKIDLVRAKDLEGVISLAAQNLGLKSEQIIPVVAAGSLPGVRS